MSDRTKVMNDYGKCEVEEVETLQNIEWQGNFKIVTDMALLDMNESEYHRIFPDGVPFTEFKSKLKNNDLDLVNLLGQEEIETLIDYDETLIDYDRFLEAMIENGHQYTEFHTMHYEVDPEYDYNGFNIRLEFDVQCEGNCLEWEDLSKYAREAIINSILKGEKEGKYEEIIYEDNYYILYPGNGVFASIETVGTIDELMDEYKEGNIRNIVSLMAALDHAGEWEKLEDIKRENTLEAVKNKALSKMDKKNTKDNIKKEERER